MNSISANQVSYAVIFDLDGVISDTASVHARAWKEMFDRFLSENGFFLLGQSEFDLSTDYTSYVDGKIRSEGIRSFLASRNIEIPMGLQDDAMAISINGLGNVKNTIFKELIEREGVQIFNDALECLRSLREKSIPIAVASSSKNCISILRHAGIDGFFSVVVDGIYLDENGLRSKPSPDIFIEAARLLGVSLANVAIVEDAPSGVIAARESNPALVIGIDRHGGERGLLQFGANIVLPNLAELTRILESRMFSTNVDCQS